MELSQHHDPKVAGAEIVGVEPQGEVKMRQSGTPIAFATIEFRKLVVAGGLPSLIPDRFVKGVVSFFFSSQVAEGLTEIVERLAIVGIGIAEGLSLDGLTEMLFRPSELTSTQMPQPERIVAAGITRITT